MNPLTTCPRCKARSPEEAATMCRPTTDVTGERWCPGTEWPLEQLWSGEITEDQARSAMAAEEARWAAAVAVDPCATCEGEQFEGHVCDDCGAEADSRGGYVLRWSAREDDGPGDSGGPS